MADKPKLDDRGFHCDDCTEICQSNKNPKYHPDNEVEYRKRLNSYG